MDLLEIEFSNPVYLPGQTVNGQIHIQTRKNIKATWIKVCIHGIAETHWTHHERRSRMNTSGYSETINEHVNYSSEEKYVEGETVVWSANKQSNIIPAGFHKFQFAFLLPPNLPPSYEGSHGCIRYSIHVELDLPWKLNKKLKRSFTVVPVFDLNMMPIVARPMIQTATKDFGLFSKKRDVNVTVTVPKQGFVPGELLNMTINVENNSRKEFHSARAKIMQNAKFRAKRGVSATPFNPSCSDYRNSHQGEKCESKIVAEHRENVKILPMSSSQLSLSLTIPATVPSFNNCTIISVDYCLHVKIATSSIGSQIKSEFLLVIGTVPMNTVTPSSLLAPAHQYPPPSVPYPTVPPAMVPSHYPPIAPVVAPSAPPLPEQSNSSAPPPLYQTVSPSAPPPSYEESILGNEKQRGF